VPSRSSVRLSELLPGDRAIVQRINDADPDLLRYLSSIGLTPNIAVTILEASPFDDNLHVYIDGQPASVVLGVRVTRQIFVKPE